MRAGCGGFFWRVKMGTKGRSFYELERLEIESLVSLLNTRRARRLKEGPEMTYEELVAFAAVEGDLDDGSAEMCVDMMRGPHARYESHF